MQAGLPVRVRFARRPARVGPWTSLPLPRLFLNHWQPSTSLPSPAAAG